jgi:hypothetical protein
MLLPLHEKSRVLGYQVNKKLFLVVYALAILQYAAYLLRNGVHVESPIPTHNLAMF